MPELRLAELADASRLAEINVASWREAYRGIVDDAFLEAMSVDQRVERWRVFLEDPGGQRALVISDDRRVVGYVWVANYEGVGEVRAIYLDPTVWSKGMGAQLLQGAERELVEMGTTWAFLWVLRDNERARSFYERMGWERDSHFGFFTLGDREMMEVRYQKVWR